MKVTGLIAKKNFHTREGGLAIRGVKGKPLPPLNFSTAKRLIEAGFARRKQTRKKKEA
jgi:hypothetical protein